MKKLILVFIILGLFTGFLYSQPAPEPIELGWTASPSTDILAGYNMYRSEVSGGDYVKINTELIPGETYTDSNITWNVTYYYVCRAVSLWDVESVNSNEAWEIRTAPVPDPAADLEAKKN